MLSEFEIIYKKEIKYPNTILSGNKEVENLGDEIKGRLDQGVIVLASVKDDKISFVVMATKELNKKGIHAGNLIKSIAGVTGGSGGGRPDMAQAGGRDISKLEEALSIVPELLKEQIK